MNDIEEFIKTAFCTAKILGILAIGVLVVMYPFTPHFVEEVVAGLLRML